MKSICAEQIQNSVNFMIDANIKSYIDIREYSNEIGDVYLKNSLKTYEYMICVDEIFSNSIMHAYPQKRGKVNFKVLINEDYLITTIRDYGVGIPEEYILQIPEPNINKLENCGRGLSIVNNLSQKLIINKCKNKGTKVTFYFERM